MRYFRQLAILFAICVAGDVLSMLLGSKLPANVLGMTLLFLLLVCGAVKLVQVEQVADFFLQNMAFLFLPACLGIIDVFPVIAPNLLPILAVILLTTCITAVATAGTVHLVLYLQARTRKEEQ